MKIKNVWNHHLVFWWNTRFLGQFLFPSFRLNWTLSDSDDEASSVDQASPGRKSLHRRKTNMDTKNCHIQKEIHFKHPSFLVSMLDVGGQSRERERERVEHEKTKPPTSFKSPNSTSSDTCVHSQILTFHQPRFPWNKGISLTKTTIWGPRSCEVAIIWPDVYISISTRQTPCSKKSHPSWCLVLWNACDFYHTVHA